MKLCELNAAMGTDARLVGDVSRGAVAETFVAGVRRLIAGRLAGIRARVPENTDLSLLLPGKMLRTRLAARLATGSVDSADFRPIQQACAATEMVHTASLCHDDVIDSGLIRRARPALWTTVGASGAILVGDLLLCEAMSLLLEAGSGRYAAAFVEKLTESVEAESAQELVFRGKNLDYETCLQLARSKTGTLFAFTASLCCRRDTAEYRALEEAGYRVGTAYQLADDLLDVSGEQSVAGKTLGSDHKRGKHTIAQMEPDGRRDTLRLICELCGSACGLLADLPAMRDGLADFLSSDMQPVIRVCAGDINLCGATA